MKSIRLQPSFFTLGRAVSIFAYIVLCSVTLQGCASIRSLSERRIETIGEFMRVGGRTRVIAHRGFSSVAPENTLAAFYQAIGAGADMIELDVLLTKDGRVVCIHDSTLERTTGRPGAVQDFTLAELKTLDAGSWFSPEFENERLPSLAQVLDLTRGTILLNIEIKTEAVTDDFEGGIEEKVIALVRERAMEDEVMITSFDVRALQHVRGLDEKIATATLYNEDRQHDQGPLEIMAEAGSRGFNLSKDQVTAEIVRQCHEHGLPVGVYTVNETPEMRRLIRMGVHTIITDRPDVLLEIVN